MIVIPTNNAPTHLKNLIVAIEQHGCEGHEIFIVDTHSTLPEAKLYLEELKNYDGPLNLRIEECEEGIGYEIGALIHAFRNSDCEDYLLIHDSTLPLRSGWINEFYTRRKELHIVSYCAFQPVFLACSDKHKEYITKIVGDNAAIPQSGIFGSIHLTSHSILENLDKKGYFKKENMPNCKYHSESWERILSIIYHDNGYIVNSIIPTFDIGAMLQGYPFLRKTWLQRQ